MNRSSLEDVVKSFRGLKVLVVGDTMLDEFSYGTSTRKSPETQVPILRITEKRRYPGGAANVAMNIKALGGTPFLVAPIGDDPEGMALIKLLEAAGISSSFLFFGKRQTTVKNRIFLDGAPLNRIDEEDDHDLYEAEFALLKEAVLKALVLSDVVILQDYDKGCLTATTIAWLISETKAAGLPIAVDPKFRNIHHYREVDLLKPNQIESETAIAGKLEGHVPWEKLETFRSAHSIGTLIVTLGERGLLACSSSDQIQMPAIPLKTPNVAGAGDAVISVAALGLARGTPLMILAKLASMYGSLVCQKPEIEPVHSEELMDHIQSLGF